MTKLMLTNFLILLSFRFHGENYEFSIAFGVKNLLQFQMNLIGIFANIPVVPQLSLEYLKSVLELLEDRTITAFFIWIQVNGIVDEDFFDIDNLKPLKVAK